MRRATFADTLTDSEASFGFALRPSARNGYVVALELQGGLLAVKAMHNGEVEYVLCDEDLAPIYAPARSLDELGKRFGVRRAS